MSKKIKYTQKDLKQPDKFREGVGRSIDLASDNFNKILIALGIIIAFFVGAFIISSNAEKKKLEANAKFEDAMDSYVNGKSDQALSLFLETYEQYPDVKISQIALYYAGIINYEKENYDKSITLLEKFTRNGVTDQNLIDAAHLTQGLASFNQENWQQAVDYLSKLNNSGSPYGEQAKIHLGLAYQKLGDQEKAQQIYREVLNNRSRGERAIPVQPGG